MRILFNILILLFLSAGYSLSGVAQDNADDESENQNDEPGREGTYQYDVNTQGQFDTVLCISEFIDDSDSIDVPFVNAGTETLYHLDYYYDYENNVHGPFSWSGELDQGQTGFLKLPQNIEPSFTSFTLILHTELPNGSVDENPQNDTVSIQITNSPKPSLPQNQKEVICTDSTVELGTNHDTAYNYKWNSGHFRKGITVSSPGIYQVTATNNYGCTSTTNYTVENFDEPEKILESDTSYCEYENVEIELSQEFPQMNWTGPGTANGSSFIPDTSGIVSVEVTDSNGCNYMEDIVVNINPVPEMNLPDIHEACFGEPADIQIPDEGLDHIYEYLWSNGSKGRNIQVHNDTTLTVKAIEPELGCEVEKTFDVRFYENPEPEIMESGPLCSDSAINIFLRSPFSKYEWSYGASDRVLRVEEPGTYTVTVENEHGCSNTDSIEIDQITPGFDLGNDTSICSGDALIMNLQGKGEDFTWNDQAESAHRLVSRPGEYSVTVVDSNNCEFRDTVKISRAHEPEADFNYEVDDLKTVFHDASAHADSLIWDFGDNSVSNEFEPVHYYNVPGTYTVTLEALNKCGTSTTVEEINTGVSSALDRNKNNPNISIYPNPAVVHGNNIQIRFSGMGGEEVNLLLHDAAGKLLRTSRLQVFNEQFSTQFPVQGLSAGTYIISFATDSEFKGSEKLIIK